MKKTGLSFHNSNGYLHNCYQTSIRRIREKYDALKNTEYKLLKIIIELKRKPQAQIKML